MCYNVATSFIQFQQASPIGLRVAQH